VWPVCVKRFCRFPPARVRPHDFLLVRV
jgi:hypothetical protein